ncbi:MAG TPA: VWA domain-containing protein [Terriglobia bacterium]|nr:VWA domain-containing protein [Terriglobia bacterium]
MTSPYAKCIAIAVAAICIAENGRTLQAQPAHPLHLDKGTKIALDLDSPINSGTTREGDVVLFRARNDIKVGDRVAIPRGATIKSTAFLVTPALVNGKTRQAEVRIRLDEIPLKDGSSLHLDAEVVVLNAETAIRSAPGGVMQSSVGPALTGGMLGGLIGKGSRGVGIGAAAAIGVSAVSSVKPPHLKGSDLDLPRDSVFETRLILPLDIPEPSLIAAPPVLPAPTATPQPMVSMNAPAIAPIAIPTVDVRPDNPVPIATPAPVDSSGGFTLSLDVNRVLIDALVRDRNGKPMANLRKEDFRLFEDGIEQPIQNFSRDELPLAVALVIDRSGSVAPLMSRIQSAAFEALQQLKREDEVCLISFAADVQLVDELTTDRSRVANHIGGIRAGGGTAIVDAVDAALRYLVHDAPDRRRAVILISDNQEGRSRENMDQAIQLASDTSAVVYSVKIGASPAPNPFVPLIPAIPFPAPPAPIPAFDPVPGIARATGGEVIATNANALPAALASAITQLKLRYTLSFNPTRSSSRSFHGIEVRLTDSFGRPGDAYSIRSRSGYFSGPSGTISGAGL